MSERRIAAGDPARRAPAVPLGEPAARGTSKQDDVHAEATELRSFPELRGRRTYFLAAYAVTSIVLATTVNSGFVHSISILLAYCWPT
jgi:hypothetical protein